MKKTVVRIVLVLAVLLVVGLVVLFFSLNGVVKRGVETYGPRLTKVETRVEAVVLSPFSGSGKLTGVFVGNPEGYKSPAAIKVGDVEVGLALSTLLSDVVVVERVNVQAPEITFEGGLGGNNLSKILENLNSSAKEEASQPTTERRYQVKDLVVQGGKVHLHIAGLTGEQGRTIALPDIHLQNIGSDGRGVTAAELTRQILRPILTQVIQVAIQSGTDIGRQLKDIGKGTPEEIEKKARGVLDLFKK